MNQQEAEQASGNIEKNLLKLFYFKALAAPEPHVAYPVDM